MLLSLLFSSRSFSFILISASSGDILLPAKRRLEGATFARGAATPAPGGIEGVTGATVPAGGGGILAALPMPLGSFTELLVPPALPGPAGTPLTAAVPAPAEPASGVVCAEAPRDAIDRPMAANATMKEISRICFFRFVALKRL
jgi:hypothetical protein